MSAWQNQEWLSRFRFRPAEMVQRALTEAGRRSGGAPDVSERLEQQSRAVLRRLGGGPLLDAFDRGAPLRDFARADLVRVLAALSFEGPPLRSVLGGYHDKGPWAELVTLSAREQEQGGSNLWGMAAPPSPVTLAVELRAYGKRAQLAAATAEARLGSGAKVASLYTTGNTVPHAFTNEPGLNTCAGRLATRGGMTLGVAGGALELGAATRARFIVVVDSDERLAPIVRTLRTVLISVKALSEHHHWDAARTAAELRERIGGDVLAHTTAAEIVAADLAEGRSPHELENDILALRTSFMEAIVAMPPAPLNWLTCPEAPERVAHLMEVAGRGRLLTVTADCGDAATLAAVAWLARVEHVPVETVYLANVLDYTSLVDEIARAFRQLPLGKDSLLVTTALAPTVPSPDGSDAFDLGSWDEPRVQSAPDFFRPGGVAEHMDRALWSDPGRRKEFWRSCLRSLLPPVYTPEERTARAELLARVFALGPERVESFLAHAPPTYAFNELEEAFLTLGVPASSDAARSALSRLLALRDSDPTALADRV